MAETRFHKLLRERVDEAVKSETGFIASGTPIDYASYKYGCGRISGMQDVLKICEEIEKEFD